MLSSVLLSKRPIRYRDRCKSRFQDYLQGIVYNQHTLFWGVINEIQINYACFSSIIQGAVNNTNTEIQERSEC